MSIPSLDIYATSIALKKEVETYKATIRNLEMDIASRNNDIAMLRVINESLTRKLEEASRRKGKKLKNAVV